MMPQPTPWLAALLLLLLPGITGASPRHQQPGDDESQPDETFLNEEQYRERMAEINHSFADLDTGRRFRLGPESEREAARLSKLFESVEAFWKGRGEEEAAGFARSAKEGADAAQKAALKKDQKSYDAAVEAIASSCRGCHREPLEKYRTKG